MQNKRCAIIIPIYTLNLSKNEMISLKQGFTQLAKYDIYFVVPNDDRAVEIPRSLLPLKPKATITFNANYFKSITGYNRLMMSPNFYNAFKGYEYVLIYQTDAYVFSGNLDYWCEKGYDYVGAPWFKTKEYQSDLEKAFIGVGNGGLSLRKTNSMLKVLNTFKYIYSSKECIQFLKSKKDVGTIKKILSLIKSFTVSNNFHHLFNNFGNNEDYFWGIYVPKSFAWYKTPDMTTGLQFSFEKRVAESYELNNKSLPMGCHKWWNDDVIDFWKVHIPFPKDAKQKNAE